jgi:hypothetical protein
VYLEIKTITKKTEMVVVVTGRATTLEEGIMAGTIILEATIGQRTRQCLVAVGVVGERDLRECSRRPIVAGRSGMVG